MAFSSQVGKFQLDTGLSNQSITGVGFQPKAIIFFGASVGVLPLTTGTMLFTFGMAVSSTSRMAMSVCSDDAVATSAAARRNDNTKCYTAINPTGTVLRAFDFVSFDADGFTIDLTTNDNDRPIIAYIALGGDDLTNASIVQFTAGGAGAQAVTGAGFQPDAVLFFSANIESAPPVTTTASLMTMGWATASAQGSLGLVSLNGQAAAATSHGQTDDQCYLAVLSDAVYRAATLDSMDADGFTVTWTTGVANARIWALCLKGITVAAGSFNQPSTTGNQNITATSVTPQLVLVMSANDASNSDGEANLSISFGAATSSSARHSCWCGDNDAADPMQADRDQDDTALIKYFTPGTPTQVAEADFGSFDQNSFTINWSSVDATARIGLFLVMGAAASASVPIHFGQVGGMIPQPPIGVISY